MEERTISLGGGQIVPYPEPSSEASSRVGEANRRRDTTPEVRLRSALFGQGLRFRKDLLVRARNVRVRPDVVSTMIQIAVFLDGCFWHSCPEHGTTPRSNTAYWGPKLRANAERDERVTKALRDDGWEVIRIWEHEDPEAAAAQVAERWATHRRRTASW